MSKLPTKLGTDAIAKEGVGYCRMVVESNNCIFHEVAGQNDFGTDAFVELVDGTNVRGITVALQIKSGMSYRKGANYAIPCNESTVNYWKSHSLKIIGVVYDPEKRDAVWIDISRYIKSRPATRAVKISRKDVALFDKQHFRDFFLPIHLKKPITLEESRARAMAQDPDYDHHSIGIHCLKQQYGEKDETWDLFLDLFRKRPGRITSGHLIYYLAFIPGHPDIQYFAGQLPSNRAKETLSVAMGQFGRAEIEKLLDMVPESGDFERGSLGQSVESIIAMAKNRIMALEEIAHDAKSVMSSRDNAAILLAYYGQEASLQKLDALAQACPELEWPRVAADQLRSEGYFYLY